jgi:hypothetical protein
MQQWELTALWGGPRDTVQSELREAAFRVYEEDEVIGTVGLTIWLRFHS